MWQTGDTKISFDYVSANALYHEYWEVYLGELAGSLRTEKSYSGQENNSLALNYQSQ